MRSVFLAAVAVAATGLGQTLEADAGVVVAAPASVDAPPPPKKLIEVTGYVDSRTSYNRSRTWGFIPTDDQPQVQELLELNSQLKVTFRPRSFVYADVSMIGNFVGSYLGADKDGNEISVEDHKTSAGAPIVSINELYGLHEFVPELNLLIGKKRIVWGSGQAYNPTDFLNARRDPTDPTFQRAGVWLAQLEVPLEVMTFSFVFSPMVLEQSSGIPTAFLRYPTWDEKDTQLHYQLAARMYALVADTDVNVMLFYGNRSTDDFSKKFRAGVSLSHVFFNDTEVHGEALIQSGSARDYITHDCVSSSLEALICSQRGTAPITKSRLEDGMLLPRALVGVRKQFGDDSLLSLEYLWQADGWTSAQFDDFAKGLGLLQDGRRAGLPVSRIPGASALLGGGGASDGVPTRFSFDPRGQHYVFATYQKPRIFDDFTAQVTVIANLQDLSTVWTPSIAWSTTEWLTLTLLGFVPVKGPDALAPRTAAGGPASEYSILPFAYRFLFEARVFY